MTIRHLRIFIEVYKCQNITKASKNLYMTQPTVTRAIQEIEDHYGIKLFERMNHRIYVNDSGVKFYSYAINIVDLVDKMEKRMVEWDEFGSIKVGATPTLASQILPPIIKQFENEHKNIEVKIFVSNGLILQKKMINNELDFALIENGKIQRDFIKNELFKDELILIVPPSDPILHEENISIKSFANKKFILGEEGDMVRSHLNYILEKYDVQINPVMESNSVHSIIQAVHYGLGYSVVPKTLVIHSIETGFVSTIKTTNESFVRKNYIVWHENKVLSKSSKLLIELIKNSVLQN